MHALPFLNTASRQKWLVMLMLCLACFLIMGAIVSSIGVYVPPLQQYQGWTEGAIGGAATAFLIGMSLSSIVSGILVDRFGARYVIAGGLALVGVGCALAARSSTVGEFGAGLTVAGIGSSAATVVPAVAVISTLFGARRGVGLGIYFGVLALAGVALPPVVSTLIAEFGWRQSWMITGVAIASLTVFPLLISVPKAAAVSNEDLQSDRGMSVAAALRSSSFWMLVVASTFALFSVNCVVFAAVTYFIEGGMTSAKAVSLYSLANLPAIPALLMGGVLADRFGTRRVLPAAIVMQGLGTLSLVGAIGHSPVSSIAIGIFAIFWGLTAGIPSQVGSMLLKDAVGVRSYGALLGLYSAVCGLVSSLAPVLTGYIRETSGGYSLAFIIFGLAACASAPLIGLVRPKYVNA